MAILAQAICGHKGLGRLSHGGRRYTEGSEAEEGRKEDQGDQVGQDQQDQHDQQDPSQETPWQTRGDRWSNPEVWRTLLLHQV